MTIGEGRRRPRRLSAETKWEICLQVTSEAITQADAARKRGVDVSTVITIRRTVKDAALAALSRRPGRPAAERNRELEEAQAEIGRLKAFIQGSYEVTSARPAGARQQPGHQTDRS